MWRVMLIAAALAMALVTPALADVPVFVDFYSVYNTPPPHVPSNDGWITLKNAYGYQDPNWQSSELNGPIDSINVDNIFVPVNQKYLWLEIDYVTLPVFPVAVDVMTAPGANVTPVGVTINALNNSVTYEWRIDPQPQLELLHFADHSEQYWRLDGIRSIGVGTLCVPAPEALTSGLVLIGAVSALVALRRRAA